MQITTDTAPTPTPASLPRVPSPTSHTLDSLAQLRFSELEALYRRAAAPLSIRAAEGALRGRMLALRGLERGAVASWLRRFAGSRQFVWEGKTFSARTDREGDGHNR